MSLTVEYIENSGLRTRVLRAEGHRQHVVFLHGIGARGERWRDAAEGCVEAGHPALALDFPGHGGSTKGDGPDYNSPGFARAVAAVLDECGVAEACVVGTSLGGHVAALLALARPDLVERLVLVGPLGFVPLGDQASATMAQAVVDTGRAGIEAKLRRLVYDDARLVTPELVDAEFSINNSPGASDALRQLAGYLRHDLDRDLVGSALREGRASMPCLLIWGAEDDLVPVALHEEVLARLPEPTVYCEIEKAAHAPYLERTEVFVNVLAQFLADRPEDR